MAEIISNDNKKFNKNNLLIAGGVIVFVLVAFFYLFSGGDKVQAVVSDNTGSSLTNQNIAYDGNTKEVDPEVKEEKIDKIKSDRERAKKDNKTNIEALPVDQEYIKEGVDFDPKQILIEENVPCITSEYDEQGFHCKSGLDKNGFDKDGFDKNGFNRDGCNKKGFDISGKPCGSFINKTNNECLNKLIANCEESKYDAAGYDKDGYDAQGFDKQGFNRNGCDRQGYDKEGYSCETKLNRAGFDRNGCDINGYDKEGYSCSTKLNKDGFDKEGYDKNGFNKDGCNRDGFTIDGKTCKGVVKDVKLTAEEKLWYNSLLASKVSLLSRIDKETEEYSMDITSKNDTEFTSYVAPEEVKNNKNNNNDNDNDNSSNDNKNSEVVNDANIEIPTGTMLYGQIKADINSDYPGQIKVSIMGGPLDQSLLLGSYAVPFIEDAYRPRDKIQLVLNQMVYKRNTIAVNAVGLDTRTMTDYLSGEVDYHYVTRWGGLIAANVLKGIGKAVATAGSTPSQDGGGLVYQQPITATADQLKVAAGEVGSELSTIARQQFDRPPTITKNQGEMIAIFFTQELNDDRVPMIFNKREMQEINEKLMLNPINKNIKN